MLLSAFGILTDLRCRTRDRRFSPYSLSQQYFTELLSRRLPNDAFHFQIKKRSENFGRVQARSFHDVVNVFGFFSAEQLIEFFFGGIQGRREEQISLFGL